MPAGVGDRRWSSWSFFGRVGCLAGVLLLLLPEGRAAAAAPSEDEVKAAFVLNFPKYVEWPEMAFPSPGDPIIVTVIGDRGVERELRRMAADKVISGRRVEIHAGDDGADATVRGSHILYLGSRVRVRNAEELRRFCSFGVLTVGDADGFLEAGGVIGLIERDRRIRLEVSLPGAQTAGLRISSRLLGVAEVVRRN